MLNGPSGSTPLTVTQMSYDPLNRVICTAERENAAVFSSLPEACYQSAGSGVGPDHITRLTYDLAGQKLVETRGVGTSIQSAYATYTYSLDGNVSTILDANNNLTTNFYDGFNRLSKVEYPVTTLGANASDPADAESYTYDANGNRLTLTKRDEATVISFSYDALNRMATKTFAAANASADVAYGYDFAGRPTSAKFSNVSGTPGVTWTYDAAGRRIAEATNGRTLSFTYDAASNPATLTWPDGLSITYGFDPANRLTSIGSTPATVTAGYDGLSRLNALGRAAGASTSTIGYDNADRMTALAHVFTPATGNQTWGFAFTPAGQLATTTSSNTAWNWTAATAAAVNTVADGLNRNATVAGVTQTYDKFGNLTSDGTRTFTYDTENRLLTESGPITMALSYDPMGRLAQSVINGTTTQFLYDGDALVGEYPTTGNTPLRRYVHGVGTDNPLIWYEGGTMTAANANYLLTDRQGSIVGTGNSSGALSVNYTYDAYGAPNTWGTVGTVPRFRYTGQAAIPEAKLYHYKARVYDPVSGRFLQTDPVGYKSDVNLYAYVHDDPVDQTDPKGLESAGYGIGQWDPIPTNATAQDREAGWEATIGLMSFFVPGPLEVEGARGAWIAAKEYMPASSLAFQVSQGGRAGMAFLVNGVKFDGTIGHALMEAKAGYAQFVGKGGAFQSWFAESEKGGQALIGQAQRQLEAAGGAKVVWRVDSETAARAFRTLLKMLASRV